MPAGPFGHMRRWWNVVNTSVAGLRADRFIDVRELMRSTALEDHVAKADAYFAGLGSDSVHARKPFADPVEAEQLTRALTVLLPHLDLFSGARVLDFGAGTCWSSMIWAYLGCTVIATDVSANALRFGEERLRADPVAKDLPVSFLRFDGRRFDLPDASVDRIIGIDTLHHVLDVPATLTELSRLLAPGGIAAFSEPGPFHSLGPQAQHEMAAFGVIENDIRVADIRASALAAGFTDMRVAWFSPRSRLMSVEEFDQLAAGRVSGRDARKIVRDIAGDLANIRIFFLYAPGARALDSRDRQGLAAEFCRQFALRRLAALGNADGQEHGQRNVATIGPRSRCGQRRRAATRRRRQREFRAHPAEHNARRAGSERERARSTYPFRKPTASRSISWPKLSNGLPISGIPSLSSLGSAACGGPSTTRCGALLGMTKMGASLRKGGVTG